MFSIEVELKPASYLQCLLSPLSLLWREPEPAMGACLPLCAPYRPCLSAIASPLCRSVPLLYLVSFSFLSLPFPVLLLPVHQHLAFKIKRGFPLVGELRGQSLEDRHKLWSFHKLFKAVFAGLAPCSQCLFFWRRLSICFRVPWRGASRQ